MARRHASEALRVSDLIAERLTDPSVVEKQVWAPPELLPESQRWYPLSLGSGLPGISLLFSARAERDPGSALHAHRHLTAALTELNRRPRVPGLYNDVTAMAFAAWYAHRTTGGYVQTLGTLDQHVIETSRAMRAAVSDGPLRSFQEYDVLSGLTGVGRYLLVREESGTRAGHGGREELEEVLTTLVAMASDTEHAGTRVPGYWSLAAPAADPERAEPFGADGHLNLGVAHGIGGPLALLSRALSQGITVEGQGQAVEQLVNLFESWSLEDEHGVFWPGWVSFAEWRAGAVGPWNRKRPSWCYCSPGVSRALQMAGAALGRADWSVLAVESVRAMLRVHPSEWVVHDASLCHGWAGALRMLPYFEDDCPEVTGILDDIVTRVCASHDPGSAFGLRFAVQGGYGEIDLPGFLDGAAGVALALEHYAGEPARTPGWETSLLID